MTTEDFSTKTLVVPKSSLFAPVLARLPYGTSEISLKRIRSDEKKRDRNRYQPKQLAMRPQLRASTDAKEATALLLW